MSARGSLGSHRGTCGYRHWLQMYLFSEYVPYLLAM
jgi:hypothetical protein